MAGFSPAQPRRAETRLSPCKAAASDEATHTLRYVEPLSEARTKLADFFSNLLTLLDGHVRPAMLTGINLVRTEQFVLAKLFKPMGKPP